MELYSLSGEYKTWTADDEWLTGCDDQPPFLDITPHVQRQSDIQWLLFTAQINLIALFCVSSEFPLFALH